MEERRPCHLTPSGGARGLTRAVAPGTAPAVSTGGQTHSVTATSRVPDTIGRKFNGRPGAALCIHGGLRRLRALVPHSGLLRLLAPEE